MCAITPMLERSNSSPRVFIKARPPTFARRAADSRRCLRNAGNVRANVSTSARSTNAQTRDSAHDLEAPRAAAQCDRHSPSAHIVVSSSSSRSANFLEQDYELANLLPHLGADYSS